MDVGELINIDMLMQIDKNPKVINHYIIKTFFFRECKEGDFVSKYNTLNTTYVDMYQYLLTDRLCEFNKCYHLHLSGEINYTQNDKVNNKMTFQYLQ